MPDKREVIEEAAKKIVADYVHSAAVAGMAMANLDRSEEEIGDAIQAHLDLLAPAVNDALENLYAELNEHRRKPKLTVVR